MNGIINIELGGQVRSIRFGMLAFEQMVALGNPNDGKVKNTAVSIYAGLVNAVEIKEGSVQDFTFFDVLGWVDDMLCTKEGNKALAEIEQCLIDSNMYKSFLSTDKKKEENAKSQKK